MKNLSFIILSSLLLVCAICKAEASQKSSVVQGEITPDRKPMIILGGELGNSSATSIEDIRANIGKLANKNLNTVLVPAYWDLIEPQEGRFDFSLIDEVIDSAKENDLKVIFLWFGAWKNSMRCYAPEWVKRDINRFPRARTAAGKPLEILSPFSENVLKSDFTAFEALLNHIKNYDDSGTVIMIQVENEIGMLEEARDRSSLADKEYQKGVPIELMVYISSHKDSLHPELAKRWKNNGSKMAGSWMEVFGDDVYTDEYFMAWNYGKYVENLASGGKLILKVPFYLNAALNSRERKPGEYPSAGPLAHLKDIWHAAAPSIDFLSPDIYDSGFETWVAQYALPDNILFVPEVKRDLNNSAQAYYIIGHHDALGISPFSIENGDEDYFKNLSMAYATISQLIPLMTTNGETVNSGCGKENFWKDGVILNIDNPSTIIEDGNVKITLSHFFTLPWDSRASDKNNWKDSGAILLKIAPEEYILAGTGVVAKFEDISENSSSLDLGEDGFLSHGSTGEPKNRAENHSGRIGLANVEEIKINPDGSFQRLRTMNGDETHQGRHARISVDDHKILHIKTYQYK